MDDDFSAISEDREDFVHTVNMNESFMVSDDSASHHPGGFSSLASLHAHGHLGSSHYGSSVPVNRDDSYLLQPVHTPDHHRHMSNEFGSDHTHQHDMEHALGDRMLHVVAKRASLSMDPKAAQLVAQYASSALRTPSGNHVDVVHANVDELGQTVVTLDATEEDDESSGHNRRNSNFT